MHQTAAVTAASGTLTSTSATTGSSSSLSHATLDTTLSVHATAGGPSSYLPAPIGNQGSLQHQQHRYVPGQSYQVNPASTRFLACFRCRGKKAKCDDAQPACTACAKSNAECIRPNGRRRKRTRKEMEEAEKEKARAEGREYYGRGIKYDVPLLQVAAADSSSQRKRRRPSLESERSSSNSLRLPEEHTPSPTTSNGQLYSQAHYMHAVPTLEETYRSSESRYSLPSQTPMHLQPPQPLVSHPPVLPQQPQPVSMPVLAPGLPYPHHSVIHHTANHQTSNISGLTPYSTRLVHDDNALSTHAELGPDSRVNPNVQNHTQGVSPPKQDDPGEVVESLSKQVAFLEGNPGESQDLKVNYSGCTAIHPGFNRIVIHLKLRQKSPKNHGSPDYVGQLPTPATDHESGIDDNPDDIEEIPNVTPPPLDDQLLDTFFEHFGEHFPFLNRQQVEERIRADTMSVFLGYAMCALSVRFIPHSSWRPSHYIGAAWRLALPLLRLPSTDVVAGLLLLSWAEFGENSESGLWNFSGLAIRMALDLGLHKFVETPSTQTDDVCCGKLLFWCLFIMDRILAFGTGRGVTIPADSIEVPPPTESDMDAAMAPMSPGHPPVLSPFVRIVRLFALAGQIANCMNNNSAPKTLVTEEKVNPENLHSLHNRLVEFVAGLPEQLTWSVENFRAQAARKQGGTFLFLHLWANAVLALIHHPNLGRDHPSGLRTPHTSGLKRSIKLSLASSRQIADCLVFADLFDARSYCASPFINQCLFIAGVAFIHDAKEEEFLGFGARNLGTGVNTSGAANGKGLQMQSAFISGLVKQNLSAVLKALKKMEGYWSGLAYIISVLEQRASGRGWAKVDFDITSDKSHRFISLPDMGLLKKLTGVRPKDGVRTGKNGSPQLQNIDGVPMQIAQSHAPEYDQNWSFDSLLGEYQIQDITASGVPPGFDFSSVFPDGFSW
ncbi:hypothetical protein VNI00_004322 [Paramarasmius palmivorus]|uniref:Zn(2)-C6 fungal-type domain-containing protein n=1 Tax=Paramarasmius palmivorus TaxID=297713 RepID=A0AAW0DKB7_9AGAR